MGRGKRVGWNRFDGEVKGDGIAMVNSVGVVIAMD